MKKIIALVLALTMCLGVGIAVSAFSGAQVVPLGSIEQNDVEVSFIDNSAFSNEQKELIAARLTDKSAAIDCNSLLCDLFRHSFTTEVVTKTTHCVNETSPRCLRETWRVSLCRWCSYVETETLNSAYVACCDAAPMVQGNDVDEQPERPADAVLNLGPTGLAEPEVVEPEVDSVFICTDGGEHDFLKSMKVGGTPTVAEVWFKQKCRDCETVVESESAILREHDHRIVYTYTMEDGHVLCRSGLCEICGYTSEAKVTCRHTEEETCPDPDYCFANYVEVGERPHRHWLIVGPAVKDTGYHHHRLLCGVEGCPHNPETEGHTSLTTIRAGYRVAGDPVTVDGKELRYVDYLCQACGYRDEGKTTYDPNEKNLYHDWVFSTMEFEKYGQRWHQLFMDCTECGQKNGEGIKPCLHSDEEVCPNPQECLAAYEPRWPDWFMENLEKQRASEEK